MASTASNLSRRCSDVSSALNPAARSSWAMNGWRALFAGSTRRLLGDLFRLRDLGWHEVKGIGEPVAAWAVEGVSDSESRFEAVYAVGLTDLIRPRGGDRLPAGTPTAGLEGRRADCAYLGRAGDRQVAPCGRTRRAHRRRAVHALALSMLALPHHQTCGSSRSRRPSRHLGELETAGAGPMDADLGDRHHRCQCSWF